MLILLSCNRYEATLFSNKLLLFQFCQMHNTHTVQYPLHITKHELMKMCEAIITMKLTFWWRWEYCNRFLSRTRKNYFEKNRFCIIHLNKSKYFLIFTKKYACSRRHFHDKTYLALINLIGEFEIEMWTDHKNSDWSEIKIIVLREKTQ